MHFPAELCGLITQDSILEQNDLRALCFVSPIFRKEAERHIYVNVRLINLSKIISWAKLLVKRPHFALQTKSLRMTMPPQVSIDSEHLEIIVKAIHLCVNITTLEVLNDTGRLSGSAVNIWIFENHPYRLLEFRNTYFSGSCLGNFFAGQGNIRALRFYPAPEVTKYMEYHDSHFPNLTTLDTGLDFFAWESFPRRSIKHLQIHMSNATETEELGFIQNLSSLNGSIESLSIVRDNATRGLDIATLVDLTMKQLPLLRLFQILDNTTFTRRSVHYLLESPICLASLTTLIVKPPLRILEDRSFESYYKGLNNQIAVYNSAKRIFTQSSWLKHLVIVTVDGEHSFFLHETGRVITDRLFSKFDPQAWMRV